MKLLINKRLGLCLFVTLALLGCKRSVAPSPGVEPPPVVIDPNEIVIRAVAPNAGSSLGVSPSTRVELPNDFSLGHTIGVYTRWKDDPVQTNTVQANSYYLYSNPTWMPNSKADKLMYHPLNYPLYIYGYHPYVWAAGSTTSFASPTDSLNIKYSAIRDFSTIDSLRMSDFMWSKATGVDEQGNVTQNGYTRQGKPINLAFRHQFCRVAFSVKVTDSHPTATSPTKFTIKRLWIEGEDLKKSATLNVISGDVSLEPSLTTDSLVWKPTGGVSASLGTTVFVTDMVVIPFSVTKGSTRIKVHLVGSDGGESYFTTVVPVYNGAAYPDDPSGNKLRFAPNDYNKITITLDASSQYMQLDANIEPWSPGNETNLKPDDRE